MRSEISNKVKLRKMNIYDSPILWKWANDPKIIKYIGKPVSKSANKEYSRLCGMIRHLGRKVFMIELKGEKTQIGYIYLDIDKNSKRAELSSTIGEKDHWRKGHAYESCSRAIYYCFNILKLNKVFLKVLDFNTPAANLYRKLGFRIEGVLRQHIFINGRYADYIAMSRLRKDPHKLEKKRD